MGLDASESFVAIKEYGYKKGDRSVIGYYVTVGTPIENQTWAITAQELLMLHEKLSLFITDNNPSVRMSDSGDASIKAS
jgi:hypothetical protein